MTETYFLKLSMDFLFSITAKDNKKKPENNFVDSGDRGKIIIGQCLYDDLILRRLETKRYALLIR